MSRIFVKGIREGLGESQADFARRLSVDTRTVRRWELGEVDPSPMAVKALKALQTPSTPADAVSKLPRRKALALSTQG